jgi:hypothetical protein
MATSFPEGLARSLAEVSVSLGLPALDDQSVAKNGA